MATDYISREAALKAICDKQRDHTHWKSNYELGKYQGANGYVEAIKSVPAVDVVEVVRCKDCQYWRDAYVKENDGTERQYRDDDVDPLGMMGVTIDIGSNIWSMCLLENNCGWELNKSIFRNENDFCSRGEKRPCSYEKWWGISDGIYPKPDIKEG